MRSNAKIENRCALLKGGHIKVEGETKDPAGSSEDENGSGSGS